MLDKPELAAIVPIVLGLLLSVTAFVVLGGNILVATVPIVAIPVAVGMSFIFLYAAYWAFGIRRRLAVRLYRNQTLGIGLVAPTFLLAALLGTAIAYYLAVIVIFYWIDASILAARRSDPLLRDTFRWSRLRIVPWALSMIGAVTIIGLAVATRDISYGETGGTVPLLDNLWTLPTILIPILGVVLLPFAARRSKDSALRRHLIWFGLFGVCQFLVILVAATLGSFSGATYFVGFTLGGYFLYRSARSLVPLNRISLEGSKGKLERPFSEHLGAIGESGHVT
jgi:hypothetical protein